MSDGRQTDQERIAVLETQMKTIYRKLDAQEALLREMHATIMQAKGARWAVGALIVLAGTIGGAATKLGSYLMAMPK